VILGEGYGRSKKVAEQQAAATAYARILRDHPHVAAPAE
jgi:dsRNA-specific ribonuclease